MTVSGPDVWLQPKPVNMNLVPSVWGCVILRMYFILNETTM
jgi:hypothetical protein